MDITDILVAKAISGTAGVINATFTENANNTDDDYRLDITDGTRTFTTINLIGKQGEQGIQGEKGDTGEQGIQGEKGDTGAQGIQGIQGEKGEKGDPGEQGLQGVQGIQGERGADGYPFLIYKEYADISEFNPDDFPEIGLMFMINDGDTTTNKPVYRFDGTSYTHITDMSTAEGLKGEKGDPGEQGVQGIQGEPGTPGKDGTTYTPAIGTVETVENDTPAAVNVEINEDTKQAVYNFAIPKGKDGKDGKDGVQIDDENISASTAWSSQKIEERISNIPYSDYEQLKINFKQTSTAELYVGYAPPSVWSMPGSYETVITNKRGDKLYACSIAIDTQNNMKTTWENDVECPDIKILGTSYGQSSYGGIVFKILDNATADVRILATTTPGGSTVTNYSLDLMLKEWATVINTVSKYDVYMKKTG